MVLLLTFEALHVWPHVILVNLLAATRTSFFHLISPKLKTFYSIIMLKSNKVTRCSEI